MVEVASSNLAGPTKHERARFKRAFLCLKGYHTLELAKLRQFESVVTLQTQKSPLEAGSFMFGRTSQIRTGDLYHVKVAL